MPVGSKTARGLPDDILKADYEKSPLWEIVEPKVRRHPALL
jgi:hypothetical protein